MPSANDKKKQVSKQPDTSPSAGLIGRLIGGPMSSSAARDWPQLEASLAGRQNEMPKEAGGLNYLSTMGPLSKMIYPDAYAVTGPMGTVMMNKELIQKDNQNVDDVLAHELTHVGQGKMGFLRKFYQPDKVENEAIDREAMRNVRREDVNLPMPKGGQVDPRLLGPTPTPAQPYQAAPEQSWWQKLIQGMKPEVMQPPANITGPRG